MRERCSSGVAWTCRLFGELRFAVPMICRHIWISGRVQGVGYRYATLQHARQLGVFGWVRNLADRRVEALFVGPPDPVEQMLTWCWEGPPAARVEAIAVAEEPVPEGLAGFVIES